MRISEILEARKNPELNKHIGITQAIRNYAVKNPNGFVSFTGIEKLGNNPRSTFNTPLGVYAYPLYYVIDEIGDSDASNLPFAGYSPYANFFNIKGKILDNNLSNSEEKNIREYFYKNYSGTQAVINEIYKNDRAIRTPFSRVWYLSYRLSTVKNKQGLGAAQYLSYLGINLKTPVIEKFLRNEKLSASDYETIVRMLSRKLVNDEAVGGRYKYNQFDHIGDYNERLSAILADTSPKTANRRASIYSWNKLMRELGYDAAVDHGGGVIHPNEPYQAVVFNPRAIVDVYRVVNSRSEESVSNSKRDGEILKQMSNAYQKGDKNKLTTLLNQNPHVAQRFYNRMPEDFLDDMGNR